MAKDTDEIVVGASGTIRIAPKGTAAPVDIDEAFIAAWVDIGFASEDGVKFRQSKTTTNLKVWQLYGAARNLIEEVEELLTFELAQFSGEQIKLAFGGGTVVATANGHKYDPPAAGTLDERMLAIEWVDTHKYILIVPLGLVTENVETEIVKSDMVKLPIGFTVTYQDGVSPWYLLTDDPSFTDDV